MNDTSVTASERNQKSRKTALIKNYIIICMVFFLTIALSSYFIRMMYTSMHMEEITSEAGGVAEYAKGRLIEYRAFDALVVCWLDMGMESTKPTGEKARYFNENREELLRTNLTEEDMADMDPGQLSAFVHSNYAAISNGFDLIYQTFKPNKLYCLSYPSSSDNVRMLFWGDSSQENIYRLPDAPIPSNIEKYEDLKNDPDIMNGIGRMTKIEDDDSREVLRFTLLVSESEKYFTVLIWEKDWSSVAREINFGALKISVFTAAILMTIFLAVLHMYRKYGKERLRIGIEQERSKAEIDICRKIQLSQLPDPKAEFTGCETDVSVFIQPAKEVGGDFCDCFMISEHKIALVIADVSDKGLPAAMFMMMAKSLIRNEMTQGRPPEKVMDKVNEQLSEHNGAGMFVTVWLAEIDLSSGECFSVNAGHENPVIKRGGGSWDLHKYPHDMPVGISKETQYTARAETLGDGDMIFVYTDGVTEAQNTKEEQFGENRITETLNALGSTDPQKAIDGLFAAIGSFSVGMDQYDDIGMLCFKINLKDQTAKKEE